MLPSLRSSSCSAERTSPVNILPADFAPGCKLPTHSQPPLPTAAFHPQVTILCCSSASFCVTQAGVLCSSDLFQAVLAGLLLRDPTGLLLTHFLVILCSNSLYCYPLLQNQLPINKNMGLRIKRAGNGDGIKYQLYLLIHSKCSWLRYYS